MNSLKNIFTVTISLIALMPIGLAEAVAQDDQPRVMALINLARPSNCNCYWSDDCSSGSFCSYVSCTRTGKNDGVCSGGPIDGGSINEFLPVAVDLYFQGYLASARGEGGPPDLNLVRQAQDKRLTAYEHFAVQLIVYNALDLALGFDFIGPQACIGFAEPGKIAPGGLGQIRLRAKDAPPGALELLDLISQAIVSAIRTRNPDLVVNSIQSFWKKYPDYAPRHTGRCWSHGHPEFPYKTAEECQIKELTRMLRVFFP